MLNMLRRSCGEPCAGQENTFTQTMVPGMGAHSPPAAPVMLLNLAALYGALDAEVLGESGGGGVNAWVQADRGWQRPGNLPHSSGPSILVAKKCTSIFYRSVGWIPALCFYVSFIHF